MAQDVESDDRAAEAAAGTGFVLDTIDVTAAPGTTTEDTGSWTTEWMRSATGMPLSQRETPQSTSVITDAQMKDRNITAMTEVMDAATGVSATPYDSERLNYFSRGFRIDAFQYDGVPIPRDGVWQFGDNNADMILYDHVQIVRGATGLMQGAGEPGASINFIRKRPTSDLRREVAAGLSFPVGGRAEADISGPLNEAGTIRGRILGAADSREGSLDGYRKDRYVGFGSLEFDLGDSTLLNVGLSHQDTSATSVSWGGLPPWDSNFDVIDWRRGFNLSADWAYNDTQRTEAYASLEHVFGNGWTGRLVATRADNDMQSQLPWFAPGRDADGALTFPDPATGLGLTPWAAKYDGGNKQTSLNAVLNGDFEAMGRVHQFVLGAFGSRGESTYHGFAVDTASMPPVGNVFEWDRSYPEPTFSDRATYRSESEATQIGVYGAAQFRATDALAVIAGARVNWWDGSATTLDIDGSGRATVTSDDAFDFKGIVTPYIGFTYDFNDTYTAYGSVTSIYKPQLVMDANQDYLDPTFGWNYELGVKAALFDGALLASAAVFQTDQKDVAQYLETVEEPGGRFRDVYALIDGTKTRGFELEAAGAISERWNASFGYTYRYSVDDDGGEMYTDQPRNMLKAATDYRIPGFLADRLTVGGAVRWQSATDSIPWEGNLPNIEQKPYAIVDLSAKYDVTEATTLTLGVNNVLDEQYYASTGFYNSVIYGDGISAELMLRSRF
jgi:outer membrane receptor for ferric coprogen and ferric-rhodotorulic acid